MNSILDKWNKIYSKQYCKDITASSVVIDNAHLLPNVGKALDLACGMGANAIFLAEHKLQVDAWDVSSDALKQLEAIRNFIPDTNVFDMTIQQYLNLKGVIFPERYPGLPYQ